MLEALLRYAAFAIVALVGPGMALQRLLRLPVDAALVLPLGTAFVAAVYWAGLVAEAPWLLPAAAVTLDATLAFGERWRFAPGPPLRGAVPPLAVIAALLAVTQYPWNRVDASGQFLLDPLVAADTAFHVGLTRELTLGYPPQLPGVAGFPLGYHFGIDLVRAAALQWAGVDPYDSISRLDVTLGAFALVLAVRAAVAALGAPSAAVVLAPFTLLATDASFVFAANPSAHWWSDLLRGNLLLSLAVANPVVPALALALAALVALARHEQAVEAGGAAHEARAWLMLAAILAAALPFFKVFLGAQLLLGLAVAAVVTRRRRLAAALTAVPCALATAVLALGQGGETVRVVLAPLDLVRVTRESLGVAPPSGLSVIGWPLAWIAASLGIRIAGLPAAVRALRAGRVLPVALAVMALSGWPLGLIFRVSAPEPLAGQKTVNDAAYLVEQSGALLWLFTAIALVSLARRAGRPWLVAAAAGLLALPSTAQFVVRKARLGADPIPAATVRAMRALERASRPGDVVLQRPGGRYPPAPVVLIGRRVPYERFTPYLTQFAAPADLEQRHETVHRFFRTQDVDEARGIARALDARFLALYGPDRVRFEPSDLLEPLHEETGARVYRLR